MNIRELSRITGIAERQIRYRWPGKRRLRRESCRWYSPLHALTRGRISTGGDQGTP
jgi:hypothetical protein